MREQIKEAKAAECLRREAASTINTFIGPMWAKVHAHILLAEQKKKAAKEAKGKK